MKKLIIEKPFWDTFPQAKIGIIIIKDIDNSIRDDEKYSHMLVEAGKEALFHLSDDQLSKNQVIKVWREAFQKFKTKKGARSSIEALLKRVKAGGELSPINPLVDIYNSISLKYAVPCGGEDIDTFEGDVRLTKALGEESFITLGTDKSQPPLPEEIIYKDDAGAICRCWNWREAVRTMLTEETKNAMLCIELVDDSRQVDFENAMGELAKLVEDNLGGKTKMKVLDMQDSEMIIVE